MDPQDMKDPLYGLIPYVKVQMMSIKTVKAFYSMDYEYLSDTFSKDQARGTVFNCSKEEFQVACQ